MWGDVWQNRLIGIKEQPYIAKSMDLQQYLLCIETEVVILEYKLGYNTGSIN